MGWLDPWLIRAGLGLTATAGFVTARPWHAFRRVREPTFWLPGLVIAPFVVVMILGSMLPAIDFDVLEYHLQGPKEYFQAGQIAFLPHNVYTNMPFGVEMLHLLGMEVMGDWWWGALAGQLLVAFFAPAAAMLIAATAYRAGSARAAWIAAIVYLSTPWIYRLAVIAYVEGPLCFYHAALVWAAVWRNGDSFGDDQRSNPAATALGPAGITGRRRDELQVSRLDLRGDPVWSPRAGRRVAKPVSRSAALLCGGLGGRDGTLAGEERH